MKITMLRSLLWLSLLVLKFVWAKEECFRSVNGVDYSGKVSVTITGKPCQYWGSQTPHSHSYGYFYDQENYCRIEDHESKGPWCYTIDKEVRWEYCDVRKCTKPFDPCMSHPCKNDGTCSVTGSKQRMYTCTCKGRWIGRNCDKVGEPRDCYYSKNGVDYRGNVSSTKSGRACQYWGSQTPHNHDYGYFYDQENYCRIDDENSKGPWCYTLDKEVRWEYCNVPKCSGQFNPCTSIPCMNGGTCISTGGKLRKFACTCKSQWTGHQCETSVGGINWITSRTTTVQRNGTTIPVHTYNTTGNFPKQTTTTQMTTNSAVTSRWISPEEITRQEYEVLVERKKKLQEEAEYYSLMNKKMKQELDLTDE